MPISFDSLYLAHRNRLYAAEIIRHCKRERACDPVMGGTAYLRDANYETAGRYLAARGFGQIERNTISTGSNRAINFRLRVEQ